MKLEVPYYSQYLDVTDTTWQDKACAIVCLKMVLGYYDLNLNTDDLIKEGLALNGYLDGIGWKHDALVMLARNHGLAAYREEFKSADSGVATKLTQYGLEKIIQSLDDGNPVIVSAIKNFKEQNKFHMVLLTGYDDAGFFYHDPDSHGEGEHLHIFRAGFLSGWRHMTIFLFKV